MLRGRQRVALHADRLHSRFALPGWHLEPLQWPTETTAELIARGPAGARVDLRFTLGVRGNRSQVGVDFRVAENSDRSRLKPVIDDLVVLLRGNQSSTAVSSLGG